LNIALSLMLATQLASNGLSAPYTEQQLERVQYREEKNGDLTGTGQNFQNGYRHAPINSTTTDYDGLGQNYQRGFRAERLPDGRIEYRGQQYNADRGYMQRGNEVEGTGANAGGGWVRETDGTWRGTGKNAGLRCDSGSVPIGC
jgi:hypothetical protein